MRSNSREIEASLIIWSENPEIVAEQIASLTSIQDYQLLREGSRAIHDRYLDTSDNGLGIQRLALRIREIGSRRWITLKGPSQIADGEGVTERLEIEAVWSDEALATVLRELSTRGITIPQQRSELGSLRPVEVLTSLGLRIIQDRETQRTVRNVIRGKERDSVLAELAIDAVVYHFRRQDVWHHEIEIEAKQSKRTVVINSVIQGLGAMFGPVLRKWNHSKLATGIAIERMLSQSTLEGLLDDNNRLRPAAYDRIDEYLSGGAR